MNRDEELMRYTEERDMLEMDLEAEHDLMKQIESQTDLYQDREDWNTAWDNATALDNEIQTLDHLIRDLEEC